MSSDRDLVFGMLALKMEFVTPEQLHVALAERASLPETPLGEILCARGLLPTDARADLERLADYHVRLHGGVRGSLESLRADAIVQRLLDQLGRETLVSTAPSAKPAAATVPRQSTLAEGSRYRRLRRHARGGLGEVFVAVDEELSREVALKEIQEQHADDADSQGRFVREAEVTGNLEHPGIVPVYGLGVYPDGRPYYAMRFIRGESLQAAIQRYHDADAVRTQDPGQRSLALRDLLTRYVAVCDTLAYAHSKGIIHRDLKPANVMLGEYGETLLVDWGLARRAADRGGQITPTRAVTLPREVKDTADGAVLGTPAFMPPEQARGLGDQVGPRSDVWALGAILYTLLTGEAPYRGGYVLIQAAAGEVPPARQRNWRVPRPLDAVCARAMAASPEDRYATARQVGDEVRRYLADEPTEAYREPVTDRVRRWGRRHRSVVAAGVMLLLAGVVGLAVGLWAVNRERELTRLALEHAETQRERAEQAEQEANAHLKQAEQNLQLAKDAVDKCFNSAKEHALFQQPQMEEVRKLLLETTLPFYEKFRSYRPGDPTLSREQAGQHFSVAYINTELGRQKEAMAAYLQAKATQLHLVQDHPEVPEHRVDLARTHNNLGVLLSEVGPRAEALKEYGQAKDIQFQLTKDFPKEPRYQWHLARTRNNMGNLLRRLNQRSAALEDYLAAKAIGTQLVNDHPKKPEYQLLLAVTHRNLGLLLHELGRSPEALEEHIQARQVQARLASENPTLPRQLEELAGTHSNLGLLLSEMRRGREAVKEYGLAKDIQSRLAADHPRLPRYRENLGRTHYNLGRVLSELGQKPAAADEYARAKAIRVQLAADNPNVLQYREQLARTHYNLGRVLSELGQKPAAVDEYTRAKPIYVQLVTDYPELPEYQQDLAATHNNLAILLSELGQRQAALQEYGLAKAIHTQLAKAPRKVPEHFSEESARTHYNLGNLLREMGGGPEAVKEYRLAKDIQSRLAADHPRLPRYREQLARTHYNLGRTLSELGQQAAAADEYAQAKDIQSRLTANYPKEPQYQAELARTHYNLGRQLSKLGHRRAAVEEHSQAWQIQSQLIKNQPNPEYQKDLALTCLNRGEVLFELDQLSDALSDFDRSISLTDAIRRGMPQHPEVNDGLQLGLSRRAQLLTRLGRETDAEADWSRLINLFPEQRLVFALQRAIGLALAGWHRRAAELAEALAKEKLTPDDRYRLACVHALVAAAWARDGKRPLAEREYQAERAARQAVALLLQLHAAGFFADRGRVDHLATDSELNALRSRADFQAFVRSLPEAKR